MPGTPLGPRVLGAKNNPISHLKLYLVMALHYLSWWSTIMIKLMH